MNRIARPKLYRFRARVAKLEEQQRPTLCHLTSVSLHAELFEARYGGCVRLVGIGRDTLEPQAGVRVTEHRRRRFRRVSLPPKVGTCGEHEARRLALARVEKTRESGDRRRVGVKPEPVAMPLEARRAPLDQRLRFAAGDRSIVEQEAADLRADAEGGQRIDVVE